MTDHTTRSLNPELTRRRFIQGSTLAGFSAFLVACGTSGTGTPSAPASSAPSTEPGGSPSEAPSAVPQSPSAELNFANWPLYIDTDDDDETKHKTLEDFTAKYGTVVKYSEIINDNEEFFGTIRPALDAGQDAGWDLVVLTDFMAARLIRLGWVETFDLANMPNKTANLQDVYKGVDFDPTDDHHAPWQSGMTGLGYDSAVTGNLTSLDALWTNDPKWAGKVTFLTEMRDAIGLTLLKLGKDPSAATQADADEAIAEIQKAVDAGIVRGFTGNEYAEDLVSGNVVLAMAWSGDVIVKQAEKESLVWQLPDEGGMLWTDNMLIPKGAAHKYTAELFIDFVYDPAIAAQIAAWVNYVTPVKGAKEVLAADDPELAESPLIFPSDEVLAKVKIFKSLTEEEESYFNDKFSAVTGN
ncbi:MAG TPA: spermidine/putrescine ABC transporter substrate-binding protein [Candidatus Limnocylindrales bacterium]|nr:spermidine/putrescine ABC transporter substrate-binding protein [Candidatus Limnocylindrales bacterium]